MIRGVSSLLTSRRLPYSPARSASCRPLSSWHPVTSTNPREQPMSNDDNIRKELANISNSLRNINNNLERLRWVQEYEWIQANQGPPGDARSISERDKASYLRNSIIGGIENDMEGAKKREEAVKKPPGQGIRKRSSRTCFGAWLHGAERGKTWPLCRVGGKWKAKWCICTTYKNRTRTTPHYDHHTHRESASFAPIQRPAMLLQTSSLAG